MLRRMHADLMGPTRDRFCLEEGQFSRPFQDTEMGLRVLAARMERPTDIPLTQTDKGGSRCEVISLHVPIRRQNVFFADTMPSELFRQDTVGLGAFRKDHDARGFLV